MTGPQLPAVASIFWACQVSTTESSWCIVLSNLVQRLIVICFDNHCLEFCTFIPVTSQDDQKHAIIYHASFVSANYQAPQIRCSMNNKEGLKALTSGATQQASGVITLAKDKSKFTLDIPGKPDLGSKDCGIEFYWEHGLKSDQSEGSKWLHSQNVRIQH